MADLFDFIVGNDKVLSAILGIIGLLVSITAIPLANRQSNKQLAKMGEVHDDLDDAITQVRGEVETHYIGSFPTFIPRITEVLGTATKSITIFCDLPAYGVVSRPGRFEQYARVIEAKRKDKVGVRMLYLNEPGRRASRELQFKEPWATLCQDPKVRAFAEKAGMTLDGEDRKEEFLERIEEKQVEALERFEAAGVEASETDLIMPLYFWIVDGERAVFALTEFSEKAHEAGFATGSKALIGALEGIYGRYYESRTERQRGGEGAAAVV